MKSFIRFLFREVSSEGIHIKTSRDVRKVLDLKDAALTMVDLLYKLSISFKIKGNIFLKILFTCAQNTVHDFWK